MAITVTIRPRGASSGGTDVIIPTGEGAIDTREEARAALAAVPPGQPTSDIVFIAEGQSLSYAEIAGLACLGRIPRQRDARVPNLRTQREPIAPFEWSDPQFSLSARATAPQRIDGTMEKRWAIDVVVRPENGAHVVGIAPGDYVDGDVSWTRTPTGLNVHLQTRVPVRCALGAESRTSVTILVQTDRGVVAAPVDKACLAGVPMR